MQAGELIILTSKTKIPAQLEFQSSSENNYDQLNKLQPLELWCQQQQNLGNLPLLLAIAIKSYAKIMISASIPSWLRPCA